jgi:hypothetical protein
MTLLQESPDLSSTSAIPLDEFLAGDFLQRADVILFHSSRGLFSRAIRWFTKSPFSHAALLFLVPNRDEGFDNCFVIESSIGGVDIENFRNYALSGRYVLAIKRLEKPWFSTAYQKRVRGVMLNYIKAEYDYFTIGRIAISVLRRVLFGIRVRLRGLRDSIEDIHARKSLVPGEFICSGFLQYGFFKTVESGIISGDLPPETIEEVRFGISDSNDAAALLATTPEDLAASDNLQWHYMIKGGLVYPVASYEEFKVKLLALSQK